MVEKSEFTASVIADESIDEYHITGSTSHRLQCKGEGKAIVKAAIDCAIRSGYADCDTEEIKVKLLHTY